MLMLNASVTAKVRLKQRIMFQGSKSLFFCYALAVKHSVKLTKLKYWFLRSFMICDVLGYDLTR